MTGSLCGLLRQTFELWGRAGAAGAVLVYQLQRGETGDCGHQGDTVLCAAGGRINRVHSPSFVADTLVHRELDTWSGCAHPAAGRSTVRGGECSGEVSDSGDRDPPSPPAQPSQPSPAQPGRGETSTAAGR